MTDFQWQCPYCGHWATITSSNYGYNFEAFYKPNKYGLVGTETRLITCPNPACREIEVSFTFSKVKPEGGGQYAHEGDLFSARVIPPSRAKPMPGFVPAPIIQDYSEACAIEMLSPKASATLARRCLQQILRDYFKVKPGRLYDEISEIRGKISDPVWEAVNDLREVGNIGAHAEKDINLIVDVEPDEAATLIRLIELLIEETYVARDRQGKALAAVRKVAADKKALKTTPPATALPPGSTPKP